MNSELKNLNFKQINISLNPEEINEALELIMTGKASDIEIASFLTALQMRGINSDHLKTAINVMIPKMVSVETEFECMDTCGTGGDGKFSLNISTATAFVLAANGIKIAKHGNRALSSKCGSADVLASLGVNVDMQVDKISKCIDEVGICFMFAPNHHPAMKNVGPVRQELGFRTIFNMLGPLLNPAKVKKQVVGVYSKEVYKIYCEYFKNKKDTQVTIVHGCNGMDEVSTEGENLIYSSNYGEVLFDPFKIGIKRPIQKELAGNDKDYNALRIRELLGGNKDSFYDIVCVNAALGILLFENTNLTDENIKFAFDKCANIIDDGLPLKILDNLIKYSNS